MNTPAIAKSTFEKFKEDPEFFKIYQGTLIILKTISSPTDRAEFVHNLVDQYNREVFAHPLVKSLSPCKQGCSACCHTQVSVTQDEAELLKLMINEGLSIDQERLSLQAATGNDFSKFVELPYGERRCVFLDDQGSCSVYKYRPSVCRTNAVLGDPSQCDTANGPKQQRLINTPKADMVIYASFIFSQNNGALPQMLLSELRSWNKKSV